MVRRRSEPECRRRSRCGDPCPPFGSDPEQGRQDDLPDLDIGIRLGAAQVQEQVLARPSPFVAILRQPQLDRQIIRHDFDGRLSVCHAGLIAESLQYLSKEGDEADVGRTVPAEIVERFELIALAAEVITTGPDFR